MSLREKLYKRINNDYQHYLKDLETKSIKDIIDSSYETAIKEELVSFFIPESQYFSNEQIEILNKKDHPLDVLYLEWIHNDRSISEELRATVDDYTEQEFIISTRNRGYAR